MADISVNIVIAPDSEEDWGVQVGPTFTAVSDGDVTVFFRGLTPKERAQFGARLLRRLADGLEAALTSKEDR